MLLTKSGLGFSFVKRLQTLAIMCIRMMSLCSERRGHSFFHATPCAGFHLKKVKLSVGKQKGGDEKDLEPFIRCHARYQWPGRGSICSN